MCVVAVAPGGRSMYLAVSLVTPAYAGDVWQEKERKSGAEMAMISLNLVTLFYLIASPFVSIQALKGLRHTPPRHTWYTFGTVGMAIAGPNHGGAYHRAGARRRWPRPGLALPGLLIGSSRHPDGASKRRNDQVCLELVAFACSQHDRPGCRGHRGRGGRPSRMPSVSPRRAADTHRQPPELFTGTFVGAINFSGSQSAVVGQVQVPVVPGEPVTSWPAPA